MRFGIASGNGAIFRSSIIDILFHNSYLFVFENSFGVQRAHLRYASQLLFAHASGNFNDNPHYHIHSVRVCYLFFFICKPIQASLRTDAQLLEHKKTMSFGILSMRRLLRIAHYLREKWDTRVIINACLLLLACLCRILRIPRSFYLYPRESDLSRASFTTYLWASNN